jgi:integrase
LGTKGFVEGNTVHTVAQAVTYWLEARRSEVKAVTWNGYHQIAAYIVGPLLVGTGRQRRTFTLSGEKPRDAKFIQMLGRTRIVELTTAEVRRWHKDLTSHVGSYTANVAKKFLRAALVLVAEDFNVRVPPMPARLGRGRARSKKAILTPEQVGLLLEAALQDDHKGIYYAFPFLTGTRPSEQLALLWEDVDFDKSLVRIRRVQEHDGRITEFTKTAAGMRDIPMTALLGSMLQKWHSRCPHSSFLLHRVFPRLGNVHCRRGRSWGAGGALSYTNFRVTYWRPALLALGLPYVTPHSARHVFISTLQAQGVEVGLVAKLAGHANATVTLAHYTHAVRGGEVAVAALERAFVRQPPALSDVRMQPKS